MARATAAGLAPVWFPAVDGKAYTDPGRYVSTGARAHAESVCAIIKEARHRRLPYVALLEDDVFFHANFQGLLPTMTLPEDWAMFYFGCLHIAKPKLVQPGVAKIARAYDTHAVVFRASHYDLFLETLQKNHTGPKHEKVADVFLSDLHSKIPSYCAFPNLAWQGNLGSDISAHRQCNYTATGAQVWLPSSVSAVMPRQRRLLPFEAFEGVFGRWRGANARLFFDPRGNPGDWMIREGEKQLMAHYGIKQEDCAVDVVFFGGGGNMGSTYTSAQDALRDARDAATKAGVPLVILPQSWTGADPIQGDFSFARERYSLAYAPGAVLAPDLALAYLPVEEVKTQAMPLAEAHFFRADDEHAGATHPLNLGDPAWGSSSPLDYFNKAAMASRVHTDRLHFAVASLVMGRRTVLYPNTYHKNRGMWEAWLKDLGCEWGG